MSHCFISTTREVHLCCDKIVGLFNETYNYLHISASTIDITDCWHRQYHWVNMLPFFELSTIEFNWLHLVVTKPYIKRQYYVYRDPSD